METRSISFRIEGEYITQLAREKCHYEGEYDYAVELLMDCMQSNQFKESEMRGMAMDILEGRAELRGTYPDDDYGLFYLDKRDEKWSFNETLKFFAEKSKIIEKEYNELCRKYAFVCENLSEWKQRELNDKYFCEYDEYLFENSAIKRNASLSSTEKKMLDDYTKRQINARDDDYGWLEPDGTFHVVEWACHQEWAEKYIREHMTEEQWLEAGVHADGQYKSASYNTFGDWLVEHGWILLHSPSQSIARITSHPTKEMTKAQRDFLYGYYADRGYYNEADAVMQEADYDR